MTKWSYCKPHMFTIFTDNYHYYNFFTASLPHTAIFEVDEDLFLQL